MFVEALTEYADTRLSGQLADMAFESKPVPYLLDLGPDGSYLGLVERTEKVTGGAEAFVPAPPMLVPRSPVNRNLGLHPLLAFDNIKYVLGAGTWTPEGQQASHDERHGSFVEFLKTAARATGDMALQSCVLFYSRADQVQLAREVLARHGAQSSSLIALSVGGPVVRRGAVRNYWRQHYQRTFDTRTEAAEAAMCLVSGEIGPIAPTHDKVKGVTNLGGQSSGTVLMSCDKDAFCSYGWVKNANSPVSPQRAAAYVLALNDLLQHGRYSRVDHCGVGFLFWSSEPLDLPHPISLLEEPPSQESDEIPRAASATPNEICLLGVSGNGGRLRVRFWINEPLDVVLVNLRRWFGELRIVNPFTGETHERPRFSHVLDAITQRKPYARCAIQLFRRALQGVPLGRSVLAAALDQLRTTRGPKKLSPTQAALIRLCMNDLSGDNSMPERLDTSLNQPAYLCGRLLALYDAMQYAERGWVRSSLADRYYSLASTNPAQAFPKIEEVGLKHLTRLRRVNPDAAARLEHDLQEVHMRLAELGGTFPGALSLEDQGRFAIAFHHQKAATIARAAAPRVEARTELTPVPVA